MKKVAIVGLGWLGMPLAMSLSARGWQVTGSKTTQDGVEAARMSGIDSYLLRMEPELVCDSDDLDALMDTDALVLRFRHVVAAPAMSSIYKRYKS